MAARPPTGPVPGRGRAPRAASRRSTGVELGARVAIGGRPLGRWRVGRRRRRARAAVVARRSASVGRRLSDARRSGTAWSSRRRPATGSRRAWSARQARQRAGRCAAPDGPVDDEGGLGVGPGAAGRGAGGRGRLHAAAARAGRRVRRRAARTGRRRRPAGRRRGSGAGTACERARRRCAGRPGGRGARRGGEARAGRGRDGGQRQPRTGQLARRLGVRAADRRSGRDAGRRRPPDALATGRGRVVAQLAAGHRARARREHRSADDQRHRGVPRSRPSLPDAACLPTVSKSNRCNSHCTGPRDERRRCRAEPQPPQAADQQRVGREGVGPVDQGVEHLVVARGRDAEAVADRRLLGARRAATTAARR